MPEEATVSVERIRQFAAAARGHAQMIAEAAAKTDLPGIREDARLAIRAMDLLEELCRAAVTTFRARDRLLELDRNTEVL